MNKEKYKDTFRRSHPEEAEAVPELAWHLHGMEKARQYIKVLSQCNSYAEIASKVIRPLYVSGEIDSVKAVSAKFISALLPFANLAKPGNAHSASYHVRKMLTDKNVKAERKATEHRTKQERILQQFGGTHRTADINIQIQFSTTNEELIRQILFMASENGLMKINIREKKGIDLYHAPNIFWQVA